MKLKVPVKDFMTKFPHTIGDDQSLKKGSAMMGEHRVQHLPVLHGGKLVGILTDRDIRLVESFRDIDINKVSIKEAFTPDPYIVAPTAALEDVCEHMAKHHFSCALISDSHDHVIGIFTWIDALKAMTKIIRS